MHKVETGALGFIATVGESLMTDIPRFRAEIAGHFVQFFSRNPKTATVRWHSRFKCEYHTLRDAKAAKGSYEASGKILWPDDSRPKESQPEKPARRQPQAQQQELRI
jgi:hypothetical protein